MTRDEAISKAAKLLRLSKSDNPNEAALAAQRAQEILDRFELDAALALELDETQDDLMDEEIMDFGAENNAPLSKEGGRIASWRLVLANQIARPNACSIYMHHDGEQRIIGIVGRPTDVEKVRYLFGYLGREVQRLVTKDGKGMGTVWRNNYRDGAVCAISEKLIEGRKQVEKKFLAEHKKKGTALTVVNTALAKVEERTKSVDRWISMNMDMGKASPSYRKGNRSAWGAGYEAGQTVTVSGARGVLKGGK